MSSLLWDVHWQGDQGRSPRTSRPAARRPSRFKAELARQTEAQGQAQEVAYFFEIAQIWPWKSAASGMTGFCLPRQRMTFHLLAEGRTPSLLATPLGAEMIVVSLGPTAGLEPASASNYPSPGSKPGGIRGRWRSRQDSNLRPPRPQHGALFRLSYGNKGQVSEKRCPVSTQGMMSPSGAASIRGGTRPVEICDDGHHLAPADWSAWIAGRVASVKGEGA